MVSGAVYQCPPRTRRRSASTAAVATPAAGLVAIGEIGQLNGQALACGQMDIVKQVKELVIEHAPKTRSYSERFEEQTNSAFLAQGNGQQARPTAENFASQLRELSKRLQLALPAPPASGQGMQRPLKKLLVALLASGLALPTTARDGVADQQASATAPTPLSGRYLLMDANGRAVSNEDFPGRFQLLTFGYTFCPDVWPTTLAEMALVINSLGDDADRVQALFVTVDPERDTASVLRSYVAFFDPRIISLSSSPAIVRRRSAIATRRRWARTRRRRSDFPRSPGGPLMRSASLVLLLLLAPTLSASAAETLSWPQLTSALQVGNCPDENELQYTFTGYCSDNRRMYEQETGACTDYRPEAQERLAVGSGRRVYRLSLVRRVGSADQGRERCTDVDRQERQNQRSDV